MANIGWGNVEQTVDNQFAEGLSCATSRNIIWYYFRRIWTSGDLDFKVELSLTGQSVIQLGMGIL